MDTTDIKEREKKNLVMIAHCQEKGKHEQKQQLVGV